MLLKAPIHNLTLSLICRFEVNCLHINPIIGEIFLIYINFQQKFPYFSSYDNFYCIEICLPTAYFTSSRCVLKRGYPKFGLFFSKRPAGFHCRKRPTPPFTNIWSHCPWALQSAATVKHQTPDWSKVSLYPLPIFLSKNQLDTEGPVSGPSCYSSPGPNSR